MPPTNNLPVQLNSFVGRDREEAEVEHLLADSHLVTLTGPGGVGKTRLALQVASRMVSSFKDGVWLIELAALTEPHLVVPSVAQVLGVKEMPGQPFLTTLTQFCYSRRFLLILDNCEHLLEASAGLAQHLLLNCPDIRLLATSRESLNIPGETVKSIEPLNLPDLQHLPGLDQLQNYPAVKLFTDRALLIQPHFKLTDQNAPAISQICYQLDGLPLALELAVVRLRSLTAEQIAIRLKENFGLLSQGARTALPRQQSLYALIDWSYSLLSKKEKILFERLAVFVRDWSLEAAEAVCSGEGVEPFEVLDILSQLVNKSLVIMVERQGAARYYFLEAVKQFALEKLTHSGETFFVRHRLLAWALQLGREAGGQLWAGATQAHWFGTLEAEHDNLRAALKWGLTNEPILAGQLAWELTIFWDAHGYLSEGRRWIEAALDLVNSGHLSLVLKAQLYFAAGWLAHRQNDYETAERFCRESLALFRQEDDQNQERVLNVMLNLGWIALCQDKLDEARQQLEESLALARDLKNEYCVAASLSYLAIVALLESQLEKALPLCEESVQLCRGLGSSHYLGWALTARGATALFLGEFEQAQAYFLEGLQQLEKVGERIVMPYILLGLAVVDLLQEQPLRGVRLFGKAEALWEMIGGAIIPVFKQPYEMAVMYASIQLDESTLIKAWAEGREMSLNQLLADPAPDPSLNESEREEIQAPTGKANSAVTPAFATSNRNQKPGSQKSHKQELIKSKQAKDGNSSPYPAGLSGREVEVLRLLAAGKSNAEIGRELSLSTLTINTYLRTIYSKLDVSSRNAATRLAFEMGLI